MVGEDLYIVLIAFHAWSNLSLSGEPYSRFPDIIHTFLNRAVECDCRSRLSDLEVVCHF
jgi:hypothetical protein